MSPQIVSEHLMVNDVFAAIRYAMLNKLLGQGSLTPPQQRLKDRLVLELEKAVAGPTL